MSPDHGLLYCGIAAAVVYILILPAIGLIPKDLIASADGEFRSGHRHGIGSGSGLIEHEQPSVHQPCSPLTARNLPCYQSVLRSFSRIMLDHMRAPCRAPGIRWLA